MTTVEEFEKERDYLIRLVYRMIGSVADAEDIVQQAYLRWHTAGQPNLDSPRAWFTRVCTRLCLDQLKSARQSREQYVGQWLPEPIVERADRHELDETLSMALLLAIERLRPAERAAFLLHDVFNYAFDEIAEILELTPANCRQLASRARNHLKGEKIRSSTDASTIKRLTDAFFAAIHAGDLAALRAVLSEDVVVRADGGGKVAATRYPIEGIDAVSRFFHALATAALKRDDIAVNFAWFNGAPGAVVYEYGQAASAFHFRVANGRISGIFVQRNPDKLRAFTDLQTDKSSVNR